MLLLFDIQTFLCDKTNMLISRITDKEKNRLIIRIKNILTSALAVDIKNENEFTKFITKFENLLKGNAVINDFVKEKLKCLNSLYTEPAYCKCPILFYDYLLAFKNFKGGYFNKTRDNVKWLDNIQFLTELMQTEQFEINNSENDFKNAYEFYNYVTETIEKKRQLQDVDKNNKDLDNEVKKAHKFYCGTYKRIKDKFENLWNYGIIWRAFQTVEYDNYYKNLFIYYAVKPICKELQEYLFGLKTVEQFKNEKIDKIFNKADITKKEQNVFWLIAQGYSTHAIIEKLKQQNTRIKSLKAVQNIVSTLKQKLIKIDEKNFKDLHVYIIIKNILNM